MRRRTKLIIIWGGLLILLWAGTFWPVQWLMAATVRSAAGVRSEPAPGLRDVALDHNTGLHINALVMMHTSTFVTALLAGYFLRRAVARRRFGPLDGIGRLVAADLDRAESDIEILRDHVRECDRFIHEHAVPDALASAPAHALGTAGVSP